MSKSKTTSTSGRGKLAPSTHFSLCSSYLFLLSFNIQQSKELKGLKSTHTTSDGLIHQSRCDNKWNRSQGNRQLQIRAQKPTCGVVTAQHTDPHKTRLHFKMQPGIKVEQNAVVDVTDVAVSCDTSEQRSPKHIAFCS